MACAVLKFIFLLTILSYSKGSGRFDGISYDIYMEKKVSTVSFSKMTLNLTRKSSKIIRRNIKMIDFSCLNGLLCLSLPFFRDFSTKISFI